MMAKELGTTISVTCSAIYTLELWAISLKAKLNLKMNKISYMAGLKLEMLKEKNKIFSRVRFKKWD